MPSASEKARAKLDAVLNDPGRFDCTRKVLDEVVQKNA